MPRKYVPLLTLRVLGTLLLLAFLLGAIFVGLRPILSLQPRCEQLIAVAICKPGVKALSALYLFFVVYGTMNGANKIWGRQLFKRSHE